MVGWLRRILAAREHSRTTKREIDATRRAVEQLSVSQAREAFDSRIAAHPDRVTVILNSEGAITPSGLAPEIGHFLQRVASLRFTHGDAELGLSHFAISDLNPSCRRVGTDALDAEIVVRGAEESVFVIDDETASLTGAESHASIYHYLLYTYRLIYE